VEYLSKFLLQSVDGEKSSDGGIVNAISVMKWWLVLLRRFWPGSEYVADEDEPELTQTDSVGQAWWDAFRKVKREMDVVARKKLGGRFRSSEAGRCAWAPCKDAATTRLNHCRFDLASQSQSG
jgi:DNA repair protein REV1